jgi:hypothetical protein
MPIAAGQALSIGFGCKRNIRDVIMDGLNLTTHQTGIACAKDMGGGLWSLAMRLAKRSIWF